MFSNTFKPDKCKIKLGLVLARIKVLNNVRGASLPKLKREVSILLESGQDSSARFKVEHVIKEENAVTAYSLISSYCELIVARLPLIALQKTCPVDLKEAISGIIFATPRCEDLQELVGVSKQFKVKYGKEFVAAVNERRPDCGLNPLLVMKLSSETPDIKTKLDVLHSIAKEHDINWEPKPFGDDPQIPHEAYLGGPSSFESVAIVTQAQIISEPVIHSIQQPEPTPRIESFVTGHVSTPKGSEHGHHQYTQSISFKNAKHAAAIAARYSNIASIAAKTAAEFAYLEDISKETITSSEENVQKTQSLSSSRSGNSKKGSGDKFNERSSRDGDSMSRSRSDLSYTSRGSTEDDEINVAVVRSDFPSELFSARHPTPVYDDFEDDDDDDNHVDVFDSVHRSTSNSSRIGQQSSQRNDVRSTLKGNREGGSNSDGLRAKQSSSPHVNRQEQDKVVRREVRGGSHHSSHRTLDKDGYSSEENPANDPGRQSVHGFRRNERHFRDSSNYKDEDDEGDASASSESQNGDRAAVLNFGELRGGLRNRHHFRRTPPVTAPLVKSSPSRGTRSVDVAKETAVPMTRRDFEYTEEHHRKMQSENLTRSKSSWLPSRDSTLTSDADRLEAKRSSSSKTMASEVSGQGSFARRSDENWARKEATRSFEIDDRARPESLDDKESPRSLASQSSMNSIGSPMGTPKREKKASAYERMASTVASFRANRR